MSCRSHTSGRPATRQRRIALYDNTTVVHTYPIRHALFFTTCNSFSLAPCANARIELFLPTNLTFPPYLRRHSDEHFRQWCAYQLFSDSDSELYSQAPDGGITGNISIRKTKKFCPFNLLLVTGESSIVVLVVLTSFLRNMYSHLSDVRQKKLTLAQLQKSVAR
jgi:hypothetical protein